MGIHVFIIQQLKHKISKSNILHLFDFQVDGGALEVMLDVHITLSRPFVCHLLLELQKTDVIFIRVVEVLFNWAVFQRFFYNLAFHYANRGYLEQQI